MDDTILRTERLVLRYQRKGDVKFLVDLWMDSGMTAYTGGPREKAMLIEEFRRVAEDPRKLEYDLWMVELKGNHEVIGQAGFIPKEIKGKEQVELNYYIAKPWQRKGYGTEIAKALVKHAFGTKNLDLLVAIIDPDNEASKALAKAVGMKYWMNEERSGKAKSVYVIRKGVG